jgi:putative hemolysin
MSRPARFADVDVDIDLHQETPVRFSYSGPEHDWATRSFIRAVERISGQRDLERLYRGWVASPRPGETIFDAGVRLLQVGIHTAAGDWARLPRRGPVLVIANHPYGVVDGLVVGHLVNAVRPDMKIMTHALLCQPPEARDYLLPVDFGASAQARATSLQTRQRAQDWLRQGHTLVVFPSGSVATALRPFTGPALEPPWYPFVSKLARLADVVVPVYIHGQNSRLFQVASHVRYPLRLSLLFRETMRLRRRTLKVSVGDPLSREQIATIDGRAELLRALRVRTLSLKRDPAFDPLEEFHWPPHIRWN